MFSGLGACSIDGGPPLLLVPGNWTPAGTIRLDATARPSGPCNPRSDHTGLDPAGLEYIVGGLEAPANASAALFNGPAGTQESPGGGRVTVAFYDNAPFSDFSAGDVIVVTQDGLPEGALSGAWISVFFNGNNIALAAISA